MSRNNVLHLWPFVIEDLRSLGAKKFFGKFCAGAIDHISIRQVQCILLKVALLLGVEVHTEVSFENLIEPDLNDSEYSLTNSFAVWGNIDLVLVCNISMTQISFILGQDT